MPSFEALRAARSLQGRRAIVTGAAGGMGRATARILAAEGAQVAVVDLNGEAAEAAAQQIRDAGGQARAWALDVADAAAVVRVVDEIAAAFGGLDILVNNAGISVRRPIDDADYAPGWDRALAVMLTGPMQMVRAALPYLRRSNAARIVNIASTEALGATAGHSPYSAAKVGRHRPDTLAGGGTRPRRHHRQLHLPRTDPHADDRGRARGAQGHCSRSAALRWRATASPRRWRRSRSACACRRRRT
jgi:hypothetical protein